MVLASTTTTTTTTTGSTRRPVALLVLSSCLFSTRAFCRRTLTPPMAAHNPKRMTRTTGRTVARPSVEAQREWIVSSLSGNNDSSPSSRRTEENGSSTTPSNQGRRLPFPTHLILHFDINETILLGDDAGGDSRHDSLQKMLAKSAFCKLPSRTKEETDDVCSSSSTSSISWDHTQQAHPTHWWDGQEMGRETSMPPLYTGWEWPLGCCPYYRTGYKKFSKRFVDEHHGRIYKPVLEACEEALAKNSAPNNHILPAFYQTLEMLVARAQVNKEESFQIVFRTFGSDIEDIAQLVTDFAQGKHPDYPHFRFPGLELPKERLYQGRWKAASAQRDDEEKVVGSKESSTSGHYIYELWTADETKVIASGDDAIVKFLSQHSICGIRDDYDFWSRNGWDPTAGKPVWVPSYDTVVKSRDQTNNNKNNKETPYEHHLFFDDNIHNLEHDGIACVRRQRNINGPYTTLDGSTMHPESQGVHLIRVPTIEPVLNPSWYVEQILLARDRLQVRLQRKADNMKAGKE